MSLRNEKDSIIEIVKDHRSYFEHNHKIFEIMEGKLIHYLEKEIKDSFSEETFKNIQDRVTPINFLRRIVDKLSKIYTKPPERKVIIEGMEKTPEKDEKLLDYYEEKMEVNLKFSSWNEFFNAMKGSLAMPFVDSETMEPRVRIIPYSQFLPISTDPDDPTKMTRLVVLMGEMMVDLNGKNEVKEVIYIYSDQEFLPVTMDGDIIDSILLLNDNIDGVNPYGKIPAAYVNRSINLLVPLADDDLFKMSLLLPILLTDLNFAVKFQCFSILYGINVDEENLKISPNAFWRFKTEEGAEKVEVGSIKPTVDILEVLKLIQAQLALWLETRNIRTSQVQATNAVEAMNGISKIIDEMDTSEDRQKQVSFFSAGEADFWDLIVNYMHPYWRRTNEIEVREEFTPGARVETTFLEQRPNVKRSEVLDTGLKEVDAGLTTKKRLKKRLDPEMSDTEIDKLLEEAAIENTITIIQEEDTQNE
jgi:hypothetical protein